MLLPRLQARRAALPERADYPKILLIAALFGLFTTNFNVSVLGVVLPQLVRELHSSNSTMSWAVAGPMLAIAVLGPTAGKLGDLYGRRRVFLVGLAGCGIFAAFTATATTPLAMIGFRTLSAGFGSAAAPAAMAIIATFFPRERRVKALGYWGLVLAGGPVLGMVVGAPVAEQFGWRWLFIVQVPLVAVGLAVCFYILPRAKLGGAAHFDVPGTVLLAIAAGGFVFAVNRGPAWGWSSPVVVAALLSSPLAAVAFVFQEKRARFPLIPIEYFKRRNFAAPMVAQFLVNISYQGGFVVVPLMLSEVMGYGSGHIALIVLGRPLAYAIAGPISGRAAVRVGERRTAVVGAVLVTLSTLLLALVGVDTPGIVIFAFVALAGAGLGGLVPPLNATITTAVEDKDLGVAGATAAMMLQIGTAVGIQLMQTTQETAFAHGLDLVASYHVAFLAGSLSAVLGVIVVSLVRSMDRSRPVVHLPAETGGPTCPWPDRGPRRHDHQSEGSASGTSGSPRPALGAATRGRTTRAKGGVLSSSRSWGSRWPNRLMSTATTPVHPVWCDAPRPAPLSPWKYS